ncbi:DUF1583 domain-containing protein [Rhodopirellula sp. P2]|uniref:DUF1583 domain-containing protein n=1 Tax=Rhodopirellula sp. P2 TaxID=2127060 RepID=UPI0023683C98|nr:DUF1583 domain-containing protein [Rhodopirellula sp. P2]WDQ16279.1 DUF1583 domain-containing protein [Rhodopirellula sp. P2]
MQFETDFVDSKGLLRFACRLSVCVAVLWMSVDVRSADSPRTAESVMDDATALNHLIGEKTLQENAVQFLTRIDELTPAQQYEELCRWVFPGNGHGLRIEGSIARPAGTTPDVAARSWVPLSEYPESGWICCPARELITLAVKLELETELKARIVEWKPIRDDQHQAKDTLLTLLAIAESEQADVLQRLTERFAKNRPWQDQNAAEVWWADLIVLWTAVENPATTDLVGEELFGAFSGLRDFIPNAELDLTADFLCLLLDHCSARTHGSLASVPDSFDVFSRIDAASHGHGNVLPRFAMHDRGVVKVSGHELDYLVFRNPLQGNFETVAEVSTLHGAFSELMVGGIAVSPSDSRPISSVGSFAKGNREVPVNRPIEPLGGESLLRVSSSTEQVEHFFNGRRTHVDASQNSSAPWVGIRGWRRSKGRIADLRISGTPVTPPSIDLLSDSSLRGWSSYYDTDLNNGLGSWSIQEDGGSLNLVSERTSDRFGSHDEDLLVYVRPIVWDARIQYEFLYNATATAVFPCVGRTAFLMDSSGVALHQITDGMHQQAPLRPDNRTKPVSSTSPELVEGWNQVEVRFNGDRIVVSLNGKPVAEKQISAGESPTFGLFHYRDQTRAAVRNLRLSGDWHDALPEVSEQELASSLVKELEAAAEALPEHFEHDFGKGIPANVFEVDGRADRLSQLPDGIHLVRASPSDQAAIRLSGTIDGDFEITFGFKDLQLGDEEPTWHCGLGINVQLQNGQRSRLDMCIRRDRLSGLPDIAFSHNEINQHGGVKWIRGWTRRELSTSGRLRLVRRGGTIYGLFAQGDSSQFHLIGSTEIPLGPVPPLGFYNYSVGGKGMSVSGTWTEVIIRADVIDLLQPSDPAGTIEELNQSRDSMHALDIDLTTQGMLNGDWIVVDGPTEDFTETSEGILFTALGGEQTAERVAVLKPLQQTLQADIQSEFTVVKAMGNRDSGMTTETVVVLNLSEIGEEEVDPTHLTITEATLIARHMSDGRIELRPRIVGRDQAGKVKNQVLRVSVIESPDQLRIALRDQTLYYLYRVAGTEDEKLVATYKLKREVVATQAETWFIGGLNHGEMRAVLERMSIHTDPATPAKNWATAPSVVMPVENSATESPVQDSVPSRIYNSIRNWFR